MKDGMSKIKHSEVFHKNPLEYWETCDARQGGIIDNITERGISVRSYVDMQIGAELKIKIFFSLGYGFSKFQALAKIIGKDLYCEGGWETYSYELEFIRMSEEDVLELIDLLKLRERRNIYS